MKTTEPRPSRRLLPLVFGLALFAAPVARADDAAADSQIADLKQMSLDELTSLEVTTMSRKDERWWSAPGAIDVVTGDDIRRSGAQNLPDALRLASGVTVAQSSARSWAISTRGFAVLAANKISVLMDGRSLFTPFFSGVQWDAQDVMLEDIDRIEVVRGPVGALWGAFAVNGFIQILSKSSWDTQGLLASAGAGTNDPGFVSVRYGGKAGTNTAWRVYAKYFDTDWTYLPNGDRAEPPTDFFQTGFRMDSRLPLDTTFTLQGDYYTNQDLPEDRLQTEINGENILGRWRRVFGNSSDLEIQAYYDQTYRLIPTQWEEHRGTGSLNIKYHLGQDRNDVLFGVDSMISADRIGHLGFATFDPANRTTHNVGLYVQDTYALVPKTVALTGGLKLEHNTFSGYEFEPSVRGAWTPTPQTTTWAAVSRAVRAPVRVDDDLVLSLGTTKFFEANDDFKSEKVIAYEIGTRHQFGSTFSADLATFYNRYTDVRSTEPAATAPLPLTFKNGLRAESAGAELTLMYQPSERLFFKGSYRYLDLDFENTPGSLDTNHGSPEGDDPKHTFSFITHVNLPFHLEFDSDLRYMSALPLPAVDPYTVVDLRLGWNPTPSWSLSLSGRNLFAPLHRELVTTNSLNELVGPSATFKVTYQY